jgi:hypothetical protein
VSASLFFAEFELFVLPSWSKFNGGGRMRAHDWREMNRLGSGKIGEEGSSV